MSTRAIPGREIMMVGLASLALFLLLAMISYSPNDPAFSFSSTNSGVTNWLGKVGAWSADISLYLLGTVAYLLPAMLITLGVQLVRHRAAELQSWRTGVQLVGTLAMMISLALLVHLHSTPSAGLPAGNGGALGAALAVAGLPVFGWIGLTILATTGLLVGAQACLGFSWVDLMERLGLRLYRAWFWLRQRIDHWRDVLHAKAVQRAQQRRLQKERSKALQLETQSPPQPAPRIEPAAEPPPAATSIAATTARSIGRAVKGKSKAARETPPQVQTNLFQGTDVAGEGELPALGLLDERVVNESARYSDESLQAMSRLLELKLKDFGVEAEVVSVLPGPVVTRFEIQPAAGVKVQKISSLVKDLARSLAVISVRIVEIIPGKSVVGIEIPNEHREMVRLKEVLETATFTDKKSPLTLALGKDIAGQPIVADVAKMPHLLVAGTTGSGKSVGVNAMLLSILYKASPEQVRLILVDPKMLELSVYEGIPHLLTPVVTDMKEAAHALNWCVAEMERRYRVMAAQGVRNLEGFNRKVLKAREAGEELLDPLWTDTEEPAPALDTLPMIVVVIDEFADMMMIVGKKVETLIARIAQKARAAGIHLILATQRPSVDVITGLIKANIPARIGFQVSSKVDSRTILDQGGAEQLLGHGDMLYLPPGTAMPTRVHGAFVSDDEVHRIVADWKARGEPNYLEDVLSGGEEEPFLQIESNSDSEQDDPLYDEAVAFVLESRRASISSVQRKLRIGYNRAARLIESMEAAGVVSAMNTNGSRDILVPKRD